MTVHQPAAVVAQMHSAAQTESEHTAVGALFGACPLAVAEGLESVLPHIPEAVGVDIPLMIIGSDAGAARD